MTSKNLLNDWDYRSPRQVDWVSGAAIMVRREVIDQVGMLDAERYFMYWEDTDWCKRIHDAGWEIWCVPQGEIVHLCGMGGTRTKSIKHNLRMIIHMHFSAYKYFIKYYYKTVFHPMVPLLFIGMCGLIMFKGVHLVVNTLIKDLKSPA